MKTIYSPDHKLHHARGEWMNGAMVPAFEMPRRAEIILERVNEIKLGEVIAPNDFGLGPIKRVHADRYVDFLEDDTTKTPLEPRREPTLRP